MIKNIEETLAQALERVKAGKDYSRMHPALLSRITRQELEKGRSVKEAVKAARSKLHQIGGAYLEKTPDYGRLQAELAHLPRDNSHDELRLFCRQVMQAHASTRERLPSLTEFFQLTLASLAPLHSILDIGCGLNPLALPWMPTASDVEYFALDIYGDMVQFLNQFMAHAGYRGCVEACDIVQSLPARRVQVAFLLKILPCLAQQDRHSAAAFIERIPADSLLVSFPIYSLGGRQKGMLRFYEEQFNNMLDDRWRHVQRFEFPTELVFLVRR